MTLSLNDNHIRDYSSGLQNFFLPFSFILNVWLILYAHDIYLWSYDNSFGRGAKVNDQVNLSENIFSIFYDILNAYGITLPIVLLFLACCLAVLTKKTNEEKHNLKYVFFALAGMIVPMLFAYSTTGTSDTRRILLGIVFLLTVTSYYVAWKVSILNITNKAVTIFFALIITMQSLSIVAVISQNSSFLTAKKYLENHLGVFTYRHPRTNKGYDAEVIKTIKLLGIKNSKIAVFSLGLFSDHNTLYQVERLRFTALTIDRSLEFRTLWGYTDYEPYLDVVKKLIQNGFEYVLLDDLDNSIIANPVERNRLKSHTFFISEILKIIKDKGEDNILGLELVDTFNIGHRKQYLFRVYNPYCKPYEPKISASSQLEEYPPDGLLHAIQPGWHSRPNPTYPQKINIDLKKDSKISSISFLLQDGQILRAPKSVEITASQDGINWLSVGVSDDLCEAYNDNWYDLKIDSKTDVRFIRISILSNCGGLNFLTLRGLWFE